MDLQDLLKQAVESEPMGTEINRQMILYSLPRWGGTVGEAGAYLSSLTKHLPSPHAEIVFVNASLEFRDMFGRAALLDDAGVQPTKILQGIDTILESGQARGDFVERYLDFVLEYDVKNSNRSKKLATFYYENYSVPTIRFYSSQLVVDRIRSMLEEKHGVIATE